MDIVLLLKALQHAQVLKVWYYSMVTIRHYAHVSGFLKVIDHDL